MTTAIMLGSNSTNFQTEEVNMCSAPMRTVYNPNKMAAGPRVHVEVDCPEGEEITRKKTEMAEGQ